MPRRKGNQLAVELFPFLSILACIIGVLTLLIIGVALGQINPADKEKIDRAQRNKELLDQVKGDESKLVQLKELIAKAQAIREKLEAAQRELDRLKASQKDMHKAENLARDETTKLLAEADALRLRIESLKPQLEDLLKQIEALKAEIAKRKEPPKPAEVLIRPGGSGAGFKPLFIECTANDVVVYEGNTQQRYLRSGLGTNLEFIAVLDRAAAQPDLQVVFLVREDAYYTWRDAHNVADSRYCINGMLPIIGQGRIDLSKFNIGGGQSP